MFCFLSVSRSSQKISETQRSRVSSKEKGFEELLVVQWLKACTSSGHGFNSGQEFNIPHATRVAKQTKGSLGGIELQGQKLLGK